ncbi:hypothetical protein GCM10009819_11300 [Agromyces tropicus]|uniref:DUF3054 domain-containing protein n=1 Tax=Agromyces tropicus TaxID=555371 RepID=A0ABN2U653_9MICO
MTRPAPAPRGAVPARGTAVAVAVDAALVVVFAVIGRASHREGIDAAGVWETAWPFLVGLAVGWAASLGWRRPLALWPTGVAAWLGAVAVGMLLRVAVGQGTAVAFVIVAAVTLGLFLLGWRGIAAVVRRTRSRRRAAVVS